MAFVPKEQQPSTSDVFWDSWFTKHWRPAMAWQYFFVCLYDFLIMPSILAFWKNVYTWEPLTLKGGGLYHLAMGAIIGVTAWSRGQEKLQTMNIAYQCGMFVPPEIPTPIATPPMIPVPTGPPQINITTTDTASIRNTPP